MKSLPLINKSLLSQVPGLRGQGLGQSTGLKVNIRSQAGAPGAKRDTATISPAATAQLQGSATKGAAEVADRQEIDPKQQAERRERGEALRDRLLDRARSGGVGVKAVSNALSRLDVRFELDSTAFVEDYTREFEANTAKPTPAPESSDDARMGKLKGKLKEFANQIDLRAQASGVSKERVQHLKTMLHERARAAYTQGSQKPN